MQNGKSYKRFPFTRKLYHYKEISFSVVLTTLVIRIRTSISYTLVFIKELSRLEQIKSSKCLILIKIYLKQLAQCQCMKRKTGYIPKTYESRVLKQCLTLPNSFLYSFHAL